MQSREDLYGRSEITIVADDDPADIQDCTVEIEIDALSQFDVDAIITEERWLHPNRVAAFRKDELAELCTQRRFTINGRVQFGA